eukprot:4395183-Pyramimonas_sp.AAC.1
MCAGTRRSAAFRTASEAPAWTPTRPSNGASPAPSTRGAWCPSPFSVEGGRSASSAATEEVGTQ